VGQTLAELDLRARTGATVVAIGNPETGHRLPTGNVALRAGDVLVMAGSSEAIQRAKALLLRGEMPSDPPPPMRHSRAPEPS